MSKSPDTKQLSLTKCIYVNSCNIVKNVNNLFLSIYNINVSQNFIYEC